MKSIYIINALLGSDWLTVFVRVKLKTTNRIITNFQSNTCIFHPYVETFARYNDRTSVLNESYNNVIIFQYPHGETYFSRAIPGLVACSFPMGSTQYVFQLMALV